MICKPIKIDKYIVKYIKCIISVSLNMDPICITIVDSMSESELEIDFDEIDELFNPITGHKLDCNCQEISNKPIEGVKPLCSGKNKNCVPSINAQSCLSIVKGTPIGQCKKHWKKICDENNWDHNLSKCANEKCDLLEKKSFDREKINQFNIKQELHLPRQNKYNHISASRRKSARTKIKSEFDSDLNSSNPLKRKINAENYPNKIPKITILDTESDEEIIDI
jgi:hypothetical protein